jgi:hypothetical protein
MQRPDRAGPIDPGEPLVPLRNPLRPRGLAYALAASVALLTLMASDAHFSFSVPVGVVLVLIASGAVLEFAGYFDDDQQPELGQLTFGAIAPQLVELVVAAVVWLATLRLAVAGSLPEHAWLAPCW